MFCRLKIVYILNWRQRRGNSSALQSSLPKRKSYKQHVISSSICINQFQIFILIGDFIIFIAKNKSLQCLRWFVKWRRIYRHGRRGDVTYNVGFAIFVCMSKHKHELMNNIQSFNLVGFFFKTFERQMFNESTCWYIEKALRNQWHITPQKTSIIEFHDINWLNALLLLF